MVILRQSGKKFTHAREGQFNSKRSHDAGRSGVSPCWFCLQVVGSDAGHPGSMVVLATWSFSCLRRSPRAAAAAGAFPSGQPGQMATQKSPLLVWPGPKSSIRQKNDPSVSAAASQWPGMPRGLPRGSFAQLAPNKGWETRAPAGKPWPTAAAATVICSTIQNASLNEIEKDDEASCCRCCSSQKF